MSTTCRVNIYVNKQIFSYSQVQGPLHGRSHQPDVFIHTTSDSLSTLSCLFGVA